jgi:hypothetical protein
MNADDEALQALFRSSTPGVPHRVLHYIYFPEKKAAELAANQLDKVEFSIEIRLGADGKNWLVLIAHTIVPTSKSIADVRALMTGITERLGGEYDGWEAEVTS